MRDAVRGGYRCGERICRGVCGSGGARCSVGRIYMPRRGRELPDAPALLYLDGDESSTAEEYALRASGVVMTPTAFSPELLELIIRADVPYIMLRERLSGELDGRVALLDTCRDVVIISPAAETLRRYSVRSEDEEEIAPVYSADGCRAMLQPSLLGRGDIEESLTETVEGLGGMPLTVCLEVSGEDSESFLELAEATLRASVYGSLSVQLEGCSSVGELLSARRRIAELRCRLEEQGREVGSLLGWGIGLIEPMWLVRGVPREGDFVCYDLDRLNAAMAGREVGERLPEGALLDAWERYFCKRPPERNVFVRSRGAEHGGLLEAWCALAGVPPERRFVL